MNEIFTNSMIANIVLNSDFTINSYNDAAKKMLTKIRKSGQIKKLYPSMAWREAEISLKKRLAASIFLNSQDDGIVINFVPIKTDEELLFYGVLQSALPCNTDPMVKVMFHDIKMPLTVIRNAAKIIKINDDKNLVEIIERNSIRLMHLINNVESVVDGSYDTVPKSPFNLSSVLLSICDDVKDTLDGAVKFSYEIAENLYIYGILEQIERVVLNLISNATKFCKSEFSLKLYSQEGMAIILVCDDGNGVEPDIVGKIFKPWFSRSQDNEASGSGLGLAIATEFVRTNEGDIELLEGESMTTFKVSIPLFEVNNMLSSPMIDYNAKHKIAQIEVLEALLWRDK